MRATASTSAPRWRCSVAAGNSGPGAGTIESPGRGRKIITVGASTNRHFVGQPFTYPAGGGTTIGAAVGDFPPLPGASFDLFDTHSTSCTSIDPGASGKLAIVDRGGCTFSTKVRNAIAAGAVGVLVINNVEGDPTARKEHEDRERSLLFVAATRARDQLIVTSWGAPSPFLSAAAMREGRA